MANVAISIRRGVAEDVSLIMRIVREHSIPAMQAVGNNQWDESYPNNEVFLQDVGDGQLWVAEWNCEVVGAAALTMEQYKVL